MIVEAAAPTELQNEDRKRFLFSGVPPNGSSAREPFLAFWRLRISAAAKGPFSLADLRAAFCDAGTGLVPVALPSVLREMLRRGEILRVEQSPASDANLPAETSASSPSPGAVAWRVAAWTWTNLVARPTVALARMAIGADAAVSSPSSASASSASEDDGDFGGARRFVTADAAACAARELCRAAEEGSADEDDSDGAAEWSGCLSAVGRQMGATLISPHTLSVAEPDKVAAARAWLSSRGALTEVRLGSGRVGWAVARTQGRRAPAVGEAARAAMALDEVARALEAQLRSLGAQKLRATEAGRRALAAKDRQTALRHAARARALAGAMARRAAAAGQVEQVLVAIAGAATDAQVLDACASGATALRQLTKSGAGSAVDAAERIMDEVADATECQREVEDAIAARLGDGSAVSAEDDEELAAELSTLERQVAAEASAPASTAAAAAEESERLARAMEALSLAPTPPVVEEAPGSTQEKRQQALAS